jgi:hypothetical protein
MDFQDATPTFPVMETNANTIESVMGAGGGSVINQISRTFGLDQEQARAAIQGLLPALMGGVKQNVAAPGGLESFLAALQGGNHQRYVDDPSTLSAAETVQDGNGILGHIFGSKERSREVAAATANQTGIGADILKRMLPVLAGLLMGHLSKRMSTRFPGGGAATPGGAPQKTGGLGGGILDMLKNML